MLPLHAATNLRGARAVRVHFLCVRGRQHGRLAPGSAGRRRTVASTEVAELVCPNCRPTGADGVAASRIRRPISGRRQLPRRRPPREGRLRSHTSAGRHAVSDYRVTDGLYQKYLREVISQTGRPRADGPATPTPKQKGRTVRRDGLAAPGRGASRRRATEERQGRSQGCVHARLTTFVIVTL